MEDDPSSHQDPAEVAFHPPLPSVYVFGRRYRLCS